MGLVHQLCILNRTYRFTHQMCSLSFEKMGRHLFRWTQQLVILSHWTTLKDHILRYVYSEYLVMDRLFKLCNPKCEMQCNFSLESGEMLIQNEDSFVFLPQIFLLNAHIVSYKQKDKSASSTIISIASYITTF